MTDKRVLSFFDGKSLEIGKKTLVMGILNITPDSFSDGGKYNTLENAVNRVREMIDEGADIIDIGAESTRPGFVPMSADEECDRLLPVLAAVLAEFKTIVSVDTFKVATARAALKIGAHIINDIWGLQKEDERGSMAQIAAEYDAPVIVMHNQEDAVYEGDIILKMKDFFRKSISLADKAGLSREKLILDCGIGFGKTAKDNLHVLKRLNELKMIDDMTYPMLLASSRKSFIQAVLNLPVEERLEATGATVVYGVMKGANIVRVHDVKEISRMVKMVDAIEGA